MRGSRLPAVLAIVIAILGVPSTAAAAFAATDCVLPSVGRGSGLQGSEWFTRIWAHNPGRTDASVTFTLLRRDQLNPAPAQVHDTIAARSVGIYNDPITTLFETSGFGALRIQSDQPLVVMARVYSEPPEGVAHSVGQLFAAVPTEFAIGAGETTTILGGWQTNPVEDSYYRYNYGLVETSGGTATVEVRVFNYHGGERVRQTVTVGPYEVRQWNLSNLLGDANAWAVYLELEVISGDGGLVAFGSLIANQSNDPSTFEMQYGDHVLGGDSTTPRVPGGGQPGGGRW